EGFLLDRFNFLPQPRERTLPDHAQHVGRAPLAPASAWPELAFDDASPRTQRIECVVHHRGPETEARRAFAGGERPVRSCEAQDEIAKRRSNGLQQRFGESWRKGDSERITVPCGILGSDVARVSSDLYAQD